MTGKLVPMSPVSPFSLGHTVWTGIDDLLYLSNHNDAGQHVRHLLTCDGLRRVPHRAVGCNNGLWSHVVCVVASLNALRAREQKESYDFFFFFLNGYVPNCYAVKLDLSNVSLRFKKKKKN